MRVFVPREVEKGETRIAITPATARKLVQLGADLQIEEGIGTHLRIENASYAEAGARLSRHRGASLREADMILRVRKPPLEEVGLLKPGCIHVSHLDPFGHGTLVQALAAAGVSAICMELIPRTTLAQKMDALSSQANLAGYVSVLLAANRLDRAFPMMITPSGTIPPVRVFVIGVGVAGLQAIATAKRLGANVEAFDTRPVVEEQVRSLGAKFVKAELGQTGQTAQGYAQELTAEQLQKQRLLMDEHCARADVVITTAQVFGRKAPLILTDDILARMKPNSVVVDMAIESGGNVAGSRLNEEALVHEVKVIGLPNLARRVPTTASEMYSNNLCNLITDFWRAGTFALDPADPILRECLLTHAGAVVQERFKP